MSNCETVPTHHVPQNIAITYQNVQQTKKLTTEKRPAPDILAMEFLVD